MPFTEEQSDLRAREGTDEPISRARGSQAAKGQLSHKSYHVLTLWGPEDRGSHVQACIGETSMAE